MGGGMCGPHDAEPTAANSSCPSGHRALLVRVCAVVPVMEGPSTTAPMGEFAAFYAREFAPIALIAGTTAGDRAVGEDIAQEALARANERWAELERYDKPGAWVRRVAINLALDDRRRQTSRRKAIERLESEPVRVVENRAGDPEVWQAVDALPPRQRTVVVLHYFEDRPVAEIADILEISVSATTSHLHRARASLAKNLKQRGAS